jgi:hypothetical protein
MLLLEQIELINIFLPKMKLDEMDYLRILKLNTNVTKHRMTNSEFYNCTKKLLKKKTVLLILKRTVNSCMGFTSWEGHEVLYANY